MASGSFWSKKIAEKSDCLLRAKGALGLLETQRKRPSTRAIAASQESAGKAQLLHRSKACWKAIQAMSSESCQNSKRQNKGWPKLPGEAGRGPEKSREGRGTKRTEQEDTGAGQELRWKSDLDFHF